MEVRTRWSLRALLTQTILWLGKAHSTAVWHRQLMKTLMQVILNIACDNASRFKILCQKVTGEARKLSDMLIRQKNLPSPYQELLSKAENSSRASSQGCGRTTGDTTARRRPPALKAVSLQHLAMAEQLTHPKSTSSFLHLWSTPLTGWHHKLQCKDIGVQQISTVLLLHHFKAGHKHYSLICALLLLTQPRGQQPCEDRCCSGT